jgi:GT2 family glycosyltransferase
MNELRIVIPVLNGWTYTQKCLEALRASSYRDLEIIVVDHGSTDTTKESLATSYPEVVHVLGDPSLWWAGATNLGLRVAIARGADTVMLLNNDCYVEPDAIERLMAHHRQLGEAIVAPVQKDAAFGKPLVVTAQHCFLLGFPTLSSARPHPTTETTEKLIPAKLIAGGRGVLIPTSILRRVGMLDEDHLPHYYADHDFYLRCRQRNVPLYIALDAGVHIDASKTTAAARPERLSLKAFCHTLVDRRSHRNVRDLAVLFKRYYPIKRLHGLGLALNVVRYCTLYGMKRARYLVAGGGRSRGA